MVFFLSTTAVPRLAPDLPQIEGHLITVPVAMSREPIVLEPLRHKSKKLYQSIRRPPRPIDQHPIDIEIEFCHYLLFRAYFSMDEIKDPIIHITLQLWILVELFVQIKVAIEHRHQLITKERIKLYLRCIPCVVLD